jgi:carboxypeptidase C (cathepsin A)
MLTLQLAGGHYGPVFNEYLEEQNIQIKNGSLPGAHYIKLSTLLIGNGWYDPLIQYGAYYNFTVFPGNTYDYSPFNESVQNQMYNSMYGPGNCYVSEQAAQSYQSFNSVPALVADRLH